MKNKIYLILIPILLLAILLLYFFLPITPQRKLIKYANDNYGKAKYIDYKKENETATFLDKEYGFTYTVTSYIDTFNIDGSSFGSYEAKKDTYTESFTSYIKDITQNEFSNIQNKYNCTIEWNPYYSSKSKDNALIYVNLRNSNFCKDITTSIGKLIENIDTRNHFNKAIIYGRYNEEFIGKYSLTTQSYFNSTDSNINWAMESAYTIMKIYKNIPINSIEEITYISSQQMDIKEIPGIVNETLSYRITDTDESLKHTMVYYYKFQNNIWIIADCIVSPYGNLYVYKLDS